MDEHLLKNVDPDDVSDIINEIVGSLGIEFQPGELTGVVTFGGFCELVHSKLMGSQFGDCTTQQAFYKLRREIGQLLDIDGRNITPASRLEELFPRLHRRWLVRRLKHNLSLSMPFLEPKRWVVNGLLLCLMASIVMIFFDWRFGLAGMGFSIFGFRLAGYFGKEWRVTTLGEVARDMAHFQYGNSRRNPQTYNLKEVDDLIRRCFCDALLLPPEALHSEALL